MTVLERALAMRYEIGTNLKGRAAPAAWTHLLPSLEVRAALVVGRVPGAEREAVERLARRLIVIDGSDRDRFAQGIGDEAVDLVRIGRGGRRLLERRPGLADRITERLSERAAVYEEVGRRTRGAVRDTMDLGATEDLVVAPRLGRARVLAPTGTASTILALPAARGAASLAGRIGPRRLGVGEALDRLLGAGMVGRWTERGARLSLRTAGGPPAYVADIARAGGVEIDACGWGLVAPGDYASQKVLLLLLDPDSGRPATIVKLGSAAADAGRLRNEAEALAALAPIAPAGGLVPALRFRGEHAGRGVVGEGWIEGRAFQAVVTPTATSVEYGSAAAWLTALASATAARRPAAEVGAALRELFGRFRALVPLGADELATLDEAIRLIEAHGGELPVVFQHGDPGTWNLMVADDSRICFLDWESAETEGLPLWDLLHLQRSFGALVARREGVRGMEAGLRHLSHPTAMQARFAEDIAGLADAVALPPSLIAPLAYTAWMHRALKEVTRRTPRTLERGPYLGFLRAMLAGRDDPGVRRLLAGHALPAEGAAGG